MLRIAGLALLFLANAAEAGLVDDQFAKGPLGISWGATLVEVQAKYPHGHTWTIGAEHGNFYAYGMDLVDGPFVFGDSRVAVTLYFNEGEKLRIAFLEFDYDKKDEVLYRIGELIGQDYIPKDEGKEMKYRWRAKAPIDVLLRIGKTQHYGWVQLTVDATEVLKRQAWEAQHFGQ